VTASCPARISCVRSNAAAAACALLAFLAVGCADGDPVERHPEPAPAAAVRDAALRTLGAGPADIGLSVSSPTAQYSGQGAIELATDRFRVQVTVTRAPLTHVDDPLDVAGVGGETYLLRPASFAAIGNAGCWFDPHAPVGSLGGAASVQEAMALAGVAVRLLRDGITTATRLRDDARGGVIYRVLVDPRKASLAPSARGSDEILIVGPRRLARHLGPLRVRVGSGGLIQRISLELRRFRPPGLGPGLVRARRRERVSISFALSGFGRPLDVRSPRCVAME
jgi:hypothetical protein